ncbi:MAG: hypothetical protein Q9160_009118 [Pyrenula sp. 1 TL-2023]
MFATVVLLIAIHAVAAFAIGAPITVKSSGNPIIADGSYYSADPAPFVFNNTLYVISDRDEAALNQNAFIINEWQMLVTDSATPSGGTWTFYPDIGRPRDIFAWASPGTAYAAQIVPAPNGTFYLYAPVTQANSPNADPFAIGVAVSTNPLGPYTDAHPSGPIISQSVPPPGNTIQNIDPTVLIDDDGSIYLYWAPSANSVASNSPPWIFKRAGTYYLLYAANNAGPSSPCTPTSYHACIAYGTSSSPLGPWTFRSGILGIVSSTTSHSGAIAYPGSSSWLLLYHTASAANGGNFRRSVSFDALTWDDTTSPPSINPVLPTQRPPSTPPAPTRNIAPLARASSQNPTPIQYWIEAIHDQAVPANPLPPEYWSSYAGASSPETSTLVYEWNSTVAINGTRMVFFADQPTGSNVGVPPPREWWVEYLTEEAGTWERVSLANGTVFPVEVTDEAEEVGFEAVETRSVRAVLVASGSEGMYGGVGVKEWEVNRPTAAAE